VGFDLGVCSVGTVNRRKQNYGNLSAQKADYLLVVPEVSGSGWHPQNEVRFLSQAPSSKNLPLSGVAAIPLMQSFMERGA
jgi:hypothetical protein